MDKCNEYKVLEDIIRACLWIDEKACAIYSRFAENTQDEELKKEWKNRANEEKVHILFWKETLELAKQKHFPGIINNADQKLYEAKKGGKNRWCV